MKTINCLNCDHELNEEEQTCPSCHWTYAAKNEEDKKVQKGLNVYIRQI